MPEHQKVQKRSQYLQNNQNKKRHMQKQSAAAQEETRKIREDIVPNVGQSRQVQNGRCRNGSRIHGLQAGEKVAVMLRKWWIVNKSKTKPVSSWRCQRQACAMKALQRVVWSLIRVLGVLGEGGGAENSGAAKDERNRPSSNSHVDFPWKRKLRWETCKGERVEGTMCQKEKEKRTARERSQEPLKSQLKGKEKTSG